MTAEQRIATWLASHGHEVTEKALGQVAIAGLDECYLGNELTCANKVFLENSDADLFLYVNFEVTNSSPRERTVRATLWLLKRPGPAEHWEQQCDGCDDTALARMVDDLTAKVGSFRNRDGTLKLSSDPAGAVIEIDGKKAGASPLEIELSPGLHEVAVFRDGYVTQRQKIEITAGRATEQLVDLRRISTGPPRWRRTAMYGAAAGGALAVVGGLIALAVNEGDSCESDKPECLSTGLGGGVALVGGAALLGFAGYLWFTTEPPAQPIDTAAVGSARTRTYVLGWHSTF